MEQIVASFVDILSRMGSSVLTPVFIILVAVALGVRARDAVRNGLVAGIALIGFGTILSSFRTTLAQLAVEIGGVPELPLEITDVGWAASSSITFASKIGLYIIPLYVVVCVVLLLFRATRTISIDIWNYWHIAFIGAMVESLTGNVWYGLLAVLSAIIIAQFLADVTAVPLQKHLGVKGISTAHGYSVAFAPIAIFIGAIFDVLPGFKGHSLTLEKLRKRFGLIADPMVLGGIAGGVLAAVAGQDVYEICRTAVSAASVFLILPRLTEMIGRALLPIAQGLYVFARDKMKIRGSIYFGINATLGAGSSTVLLTTMILTPALMYLSKVAPFSGFMPAQSLSMLPFFMVLIVAVCRGDIIRSLITGLVSMVAILYCGTALSSLFTQAAITVDPTAYGTLGLITSLYDASSPLAWLVVMLATFGVAGLAVLFVLSLGLAMWNHNRITGKSSGIFFGKRPLPGSEGSREAEGQDFPSSDPADSVDSSQLDELIKAMEKTNDTQNL